MWDVVIRARRATNMLPVLEEVLSGFGRYRSRAESKEATMETNVPTPIRVVLPIVEDPPPPTPPPYAVEGSSHEMSSILPLSHGGDVGAADGRAAQRVGVADVGAAQRRGSGGEGLPDEPKPRFIPLAVAIDLGMTPPIGSIRTTEVEVLPSGTGKRPRPVRRHLRLLPTPGA